jgi:hypothetical protein
MRTKTLIACLASGFLAMGQTGWAAGNRNSTSSHSASFETRQRARPTRGSATLSAQSVSGVIPRGIRGGNPLQMLNPFAPPKYGRAEESVSLDPDVPGKGNGIMFVSISF